MRFRPCIDIHNGKVKQIVGGSLIDRGDRASTNFVADKPADWFAGRYQEDGLYGGHVILLNVIVTSYVFSDGRIRWDHLEQLKDAVGKERIVLDLSCRKRDGKYLVVTDRWQKFTDTEVTRELLNMLAGFCAEFLIHGVDGEGRSAGIDQELAGILGTWEKAGEIPVTYAGGIASMEDIRILQKAGKDRVDFTVGSALDLFGGELSYDEIRQKYHG